VTVGNSAERTESAEEADRNAILGLAPDDRTILYTQFDEGGSELMLVENFR